MKFDWYGKVNIDTLYPEYHFNFSLDEDEIRKVLHIYGYDEQWLRDILEYSQRNSLHIMQLCLRILTDATNDDMIDLGINYKRKYEELVELLKPHKIDEDMSPETTLKMILKYHKP